MCTSNLMEQILSDDNLHQAYRHVVKSNGKGGVDKMKCSELLEHLVENIDSIKEQMFNGEYKPKPVRRCTIPKPDGGRRILGIPTVTDRFLQQAIAQVLTPIFEKQFHKNSFAFRENRNAHMAVQKTLDIINKGYIWIVDIDLEKFFDTVNHDRLMETLSRTIKDEKLLSVIKNFLTSGIMVDSHHYIDSVLGTPQGGNMSPLLSNIMLNELDKELARRGLKFVRYADDCIVFVKSKVAAERALKNLINFIENDLCLKVNMTKTKIDMPQGIKYLGFGFYYDEQSQNYKLIPHPKSVERIYMKLTTATRKNCKRKNRYKVWRINEVIRGWINYFHIARIAFLCKELDRYIRYRLRIRIWMEWDNPKKRIKGLMKLGINRKSACTVAYTTENPEIICQKGIIKKAISKEWFTQFGLLSMIDYYNQKYAGSSM